MDQELKAYLEERETRTEARMDERFDRMDERFARMDERFDHMDERFARMDERFGQVETEARHTRILVEALHDNVRLLAEGFIGIGERIDALREETSGKIEEVKVSVQLIHQALIPRVQSLENRVKIIEDKAERENRDIFEVVRERLGVRQAQ